MILSLALILIFGMIGNYLFTKLKLPGLLGMLILGIIIGPHYLNLLDDSILSISSDLRMVALIIILLRAGFGINRNDLIKIGKTSIKLSIIPGILEGFTVLFLAMLFLDFDFIQGGMLGFILAAVSPAVIVPLMLNLIDKKLGNEKRIPLLILSGASIDDVIAITVFSCFMGIYINKNYNIGIQLLNIPLSIILGILLGLVFGYILSVIFNKYKIRDSKKVILILAIALLIVAMENYLKSFIMIASLLGVMTIGFVIRERKPLLGERLALKFNKVWLLSELLLFVLIGAEVDVTLTLSAGLIGIVIILSGLLARSVGVLISTYNSGLNAKEKLFVVVSYFPKATVQAAIGSYPLINGVEDGALILSIAVLSIIITAPLGSILINSLSDKLLK